MALSGSSPCFDGADRCSKITVKGGAPLVCTIIEIDEAGVIIIVVLSRPIIAISTRADRIIVPVARSRKENLIGRGKRFVNLITYRSISSRIRNPIPSNAIGDNTIDFGLARHMPLRP